MSYTARDIFKQPLSEAELSELARRAGGIQAIFSWKSPSARPLQLDPATVMDETLLAYMQREPRLVRRPIVDAGGRLLVGATPNELDAALA